VDELLAGDAFGGGADAAKGAAGDGAGGGPATSGARRVAAEVRQDRGDFAEFTI
jgi:hypothetical protein